MIPAKPDGRPESVSGAETDERRDVHAIVDLRAAGTHEPHAGTQRDQPAAAFLQPIGHEVEARLDRADLRDDREVGRDVGDAGDGADERDDVPLASGGADPAGEMCNPSSNVHTHVLDPENGVVDQRRLDPHRRLGVGKRWTRRARRTGRAEQDGEDAGGSERPRHLEQRSTLIRRRWPLVR
jgi:hypothetical protein